MPGLKRLIIFLSVFTTVLALAYGYTAYRLLPFSTMQNSLRVVAITAVIVCVLLGPLSQLVRIFYEETPWSDAIAWIAYITFGFFSMALFFVVVRDLGLAIYDMGAHVLLAPSQIAELAPGRAFWINSLNLGIIGLTGGLTIHGYLKARKIVKINRVSVAIADLPQGLEGLTIAQISDLHVGPTIKRKFVTRIVGMINELEPDIIAVTGDLIDGSVPRLREHVAPLAEMQSKLGTFYVTGNHEYYAGALPWIAEVKRLGMEVLLNEHRIVSRQGASVSIGGVPDFNAGSFFRDHKSDPQKAFENSPDGVIRILLAHQPRSIQAAAKAGVHLQLSGHTHGGQFFPGNLFVPLQQPFVKGLHRFQNTQIFVHSGTGYWGPPLRVGTNAEIALIRLQRAAS